MANNELTKKIKNIIAPILGEFVANSAIRVNCERIGTSEDAITQNQIPEFIKKVKITLLLFLEEEEINKTIQELENIKD